MFKTYEGDLCSPPKIIFCIVGYLNERKVLKLNKEVCISLYALFSLFQNITDYLDNNVVYSIIIFLHMKYYDIYIYICVCVIAELFCLCMENLRV